MLCLMIITNSVKKSERHLKNINQPLCLLCSVPYRKYLPGYQNVMISRALNNEQSAFSILSKTHYFLRATESLLKT